MTHSVQTNMDLRDRLKSVLRGIEEGVISSATPVACSKLDHLGREVTPLNYHRQVPFGNGVKPDAETQSDINNSLYKGIYDDNGDLSEAVQDMVRQSMGVSKHAKIRLKAGAKIKFNKCEHDSATGKFLAEIDGNFEAVIPREYAESPKDGHEWVSQTKPDEPGVRLWNRKIDNPQTINKHQIEDIHQHILDEVAKVHKSVEKTDQQLAEFYKSTDEIVAGAEREFRAIAGIGIDKVINKVEYKKQGI